ncbi:MAG: GNAT family N-acetyltransferase [Planctomycetes bacterium]|nr:GNAT family N-acetyltransferase [Planctomycetota bacterium]MCB9885154.1 GNAT family N-acetyltransferase [Planctomycetota bacterium]
MTSFPLPTLPLVHDDPEALALAAAAGVHGVYVANALHRAEGAGLLLQQRGAAAGLCWFGARGNLVVIAPDLDPAAVAAAIQVSRLPFRLAMGPAGVVDALAQLCTRPPLVLRDQCYYRATPADAAPDLISDAVRPAQRGDRDRLAQATLLLNQSDLNIDPRRVDRRWLRDTIDERIADGSTRVLGDVGAFSGKLDFGSEGPAGQVIEGVFTFPQVRGQGTAGRLVASCIAAAGQPVCLHVGEHNQPARRAYERAGMTAVDRCRLLLIG